MSKLNRRLSAVLFITLLGVGAALIADEGIKTAVGLALVGVALAWAIGCNSRVVHWMFVLIGLVGLAVPVGVRWHRHRDAVKRHEDEGRQIAQLEQGFSDRSGCPAYALAGLVAKRPNGGYSDIQWTTADLSATLKQVCPQYASADDWNLCWAYVIADPWIRKQMSDRDLSCLQARFEAPQPLSRALAKGWGEYVPAFALLGVGFTLIFGVKPES
jgi:hypothetical protein